MNKKFIDLDYKIENILKIASNKKNFLVEAINILIVDDDPVIVDELERLLYISHEKGNIPKLSIKKAFSAEEALDIIFEGLENKWKLDFLISDIKMGDMNGYELANTIRNIEEIKDTFICFVSGEIGDTLKKIKALGEGVMRIEEKPINPALFTLQTHIDLSLITHIKQQNILLENIAKKNELMAKELKLAKGVQCGLLPKQLPKMEDASIFYVYKAALGVSGDFINVHYRDKYADKLGIFICDVSGHGPSSAMIASMVRMALDNLGKYVTNNTPGEALYEINRRLDEKLDGHHLTAYMGYLDLKTGLFTFARAAHPYMILIKKTGEFLFIKSKGMYITGSDFTDNIEDRSIQLDPGDKLVFYTDGLTEARSPEGIYFGIKEGTETVDEDEQYLKERILNSVDIHLPAKEFCLILQDKVMEFIGSDNIEDDITIAAIDWHPQKP